MKTPAIAFLLTAVLLAPSGLSATVTTTADDGPGSLRQALLNASPGDTIDFAVTGAITLTSGELLINKNLVVSGPGAANLTIQRSNASGTPGFRVFNVQSGLVTISGLTVANGLSPEGAGIENTTTFLLHDCVITGNSATNNGGGINNLSTLTMSNCVVSFNTVSGSTTGLLGGGLNNEGTAAATSCAFVSNSVAGVVNPGGPTVGGVGGGINNDGTLSLTNSVVVMNSATGVGAGGGIFNDGTLTLDTSTIDSNVAGTSAGAGQGGGLANELGTALVVRSTVSRNVAAGCTVQSVGPGGIYNDFATLSIENSTVSGNITISDGSCAPTGAGVENNLGSLAISNSTITANAVVPGSSANASGVLNAGGFLHIKNTILAGNTNQTDLINSNSATIDSGGFNLIGSTNGPIIPGPGDQFNLSSAAIMLGPLQDNGGPTLTHALLCGSPAINAGDNTGAPPTDQRGFPRIVGGIIDIGSFEANNSPPTITCPSAPMVINCAPSTGAVATVTVAVADTNGDALVVVWSVNGIPSQTNLVNASGPPTRAQVSLTTVFPVGTNQVSATVSDPSECVASCTTEVILIAGSRGDLYPIALHDQTLAGVPIGGVLRNIYNGVQPGNFGWLTWAGSPNEPTLVKSLTPPGDSSTYVNPNNPNDHVVSIGDWVQGKPGISNSRGVRQELDALKKIDITVPVWDQAIGRGNRSLYHVIGFARVTILNYQLPHENRITARFLGFVNCD